MKTLLLSLLLLVPPLSRADETSIEARRQACLHRAPTTRELRQCEYTAYREASAELASLQAKMLEGLRKTELTPELEKRLEASQKAWANLRDADCRLKSAQLLHGSAESLLLASCTVNMTLDRIKELKATQL